MSEPRGSAFVANGAKRSCRLPDAICRSASGWSGAGTSKLRDRAGRGPRPWPIDGICIATPLLHAARPQTRACWAAFSAPLRRPTPSWADRALQYFRIEPAVNLANETLAAACRTSEHRGPEGLAAADRAQSNRIVAATAHPVFFAILTGEGRAYIFDGASLTAADGAILLSAASRGPPRSPFVRTLLGGMGGPRDAGAGPAGEKYFPS